MQTSTDTDKNEECLVESNLSIELNDYMCEQMGDKLKYKRAD